MHLGQGFSNCASQHLWVSEPHHSCIAPHERSGNKTYLMDTICDGARVISRSWGQKMGCDKEKECFNFLA